MAATKCLTNEIINTNLVNLDLDSYTKVDAIKELSKLIDDEGRLTDYDIYVKSVLDREETFTTGIGMEVAIPHGKSEVVKTATIAFGKNENGIEWESMDGKPVKMVFLLAVPSGNGGDDNQHLKILAALSRKLMHDEFRDEILTADKEEVVRIISELL